VALRVETAPAGWVDRFDPAAPVAVALAVRPGHPTVAVEDPEGVADRLHVDVTAALAVEKATGDAGQVVVVPVGRDGVDRLLLVGVGDGSVPALRKAAAAVVRRGTGAATVVTSLTAGQDSAALRAVAETAGLAAYRFDQRSEPAKQQPVERLLLAGAPRRPAEADRALHRAEIVAAAVRLARDLSNTPSLVKSPAWLADEATRRCRSAGVEVTVRDEKQLAAEGFGGILGVGAGSARPPRLVEMSWSPAGATRHVVVVGKGITFDSGGLSLKPSDSMVSMKTDMAGGAAVIATMTALRDLGVTARVTGLVPMAENMPGAAATRPGDVLAHWGGRTSEVLNTDAEGRLVLADAIAYAAATHRPDVIVDIATLTGAASVGLGKRHAALYATTTALRDRLTAAAEAAGERLWAMPLVEDYRDALDSPIADLRNIGLPAKEYSGGSIVAALFLREFTGGIPWAHLDVAGPARAEADEVEVTKGATGFGVRTFCRWLEELA
jgi:leucyl aminopeptidase